MMPSTKKSAHVFAAIVALYTFFVLASTPASAYTLDKVSIIDSLSDQNFLHEKMSLNISNNNNKELNILLPDEAYNIMINNQKHAGNNSLFIPTQCSRCSITISYQLKNVVKNNPDKTFEYTRTMNLPRIPTQLNYVVKLPIGKILNTDNKMGIIPNGGTISTDGKSIIVSWEENTPELPKIYRITYQGHENAEVATVEFTNELKEWPVLIISFIMLILGLTAGWFSHIHFSTTKQTSSPQITVLPSSLFTPDERAILSAINKNGGSIRQKELGIVLSWSKSKVSAVITNLEFKKVIRREKLGRNYDIFLESHID